MQVLPPEERELKLESQVNLQWKYSIIEQPETFCLKFKALASIVGAQVKDERELKLSDDYYDDQRETLRRSGFAFRVRSDEVKRGAHELTLKRDKKAIVEDRRLTRSEYTVPCSPDKLGELLQTSSLFKTAFSDVDGLATLAIGELKAILNVANKRYEIAFNTAVSSYTICYDRFYFYEPRVCLYSPYFSEIEIEHSERNGTPDTQLQHIETALMSIFGVTPHKQSKLKRGLECMERPEPKLVQAQTIGFDIVDYSTKTPDVQLQIIQKLNKFVKDAILQHIPTASHNCLYIPTGDGMYVVFENHPEAILPVVVKVHQLTQEHNAIAPDKFKFQFRTGIHIGPVFRYSDVNENLNYAGNGINVAARVLNAGDAWHILVTKEAKETLASLGKYQDWFHQIGNYKVKHGLDIEMFSFYDADAQIGNRIVPLK